MKTITNTIMTNSTDTVMNTITNTVMTNSTNTVMTIPPLTL